MKAVECAFPGTPVGFARCEIDQGESALLTILPWCFEELKVALAMVCEIDQGESALLTKFFHGA
jgi:hypothetical protein